MASEHHVAVVGATGALGKEIMAVLDNAPWRPDRVSPLASSTTSVSSLNYGEQSVAVDDLDLADLESFDAIIVAAPQEVSAKVIAEATRQGVPAVDCSGSSTTDLEVPLVAPQADPSGLRAPRTKDVLAIPGPAALLIAPVLVALGGGGLCEQADASVMLPASWWGRGGIDELSSQVVSLFNAGVPSRRIFPSGLAFDLLPQVGDMGASGWTTEEVRTSLELARIGRIPCTVSLVGTPLFTGMAGTIRVPLSRDTPLERIEQLLTAAGVRIATERAERTLPRPRRVDGTSVVHVARLRLSPDGRALHLWLTADNLRLAATAAVSCCGALLGTADG